MADLKKGQRDLCLHCDQAIVYGWWEFWGDTKQLVPKGPEDVYIPYGKEPTDAQKAKKQAFDNWMQTRKDRKILMHHGGNGGRSSNWVHILAWPFTKFEDLDMRCAKPKSEGMHRNFALPASFCSERQNVGGTCNRPVKETVEDKWGGKKALCGIHLAHLRKAIKKEEERETATEISAWRREEVEKKIARLEALGLSDVKEEWVRHYTGPTLGSYTGKVVVDPDELLLLMEEHVETFG